MQILTSKAFKEEYRKISNYIEVTDDQNKKIEMKKLLQELISNIKKIDINHIDMTISGRLADDTSEAREKIKDLRKKIFKIIGD